MKKQSIVWDEGRIIADGIWTPPHSYHPAILAVMRSCLDLDAAQSVLDRHNQVVDGRLNGKQHRIAAECEPRCGDGCARLSQVLEIRLARTGDIHDGYIGFKMVEA
jgi:hypothetical protein